MYYPKPGTYSYTCIHVCIPGYSVHIYVTAQTYYYKGKFHISTEIKDHMEEKSDNNDCTVNNDKPAA